MSLSGQLRILREAIHVWLETGMATYSSSLTWRILRTEESGGLQTTGSQRAAHGWVTNKHTHTHTHIRYEQGKLRSLNFAVNLKLLYKIKSIKNVWFTSYHFLKVTLGHSIKRPKFWSWFFSTLAVEPGQQILIWHDIIHDMIMRCEVFIRKMGIVLHPIANLPGMICNAVREKQMHDYESQ